MSDREERCACGRFVLESWCGTYGVPGEQHRRDACVHEAGGTIAVTTTESLIDELEVQLGHVGVDWMTLTRTVRAHDAAVRADERERLLPALRLAVEAMEATDNAIANLKFNDEDSRHRMARAECLYGAALAACRKELEP